MFDRRCVSVQTLAEYIDDTEDLINITLDSHRNKLIQVDLLLTAGTFCTGLVTLVAGLFGMNLTSGLQGTEGTTNFFVVSIGTCVFAGLLLMAFIMVMRRKGLAFD